MIIVGKFPSYNDCILFLLLMDYDSPQYVKGRLIAPRKNHRPAPGFSTLLMQIYLWIRLAPHTK